MPVCVKCGKKFPTYMKIEGTLKNLGSRKRCLECSPFGTHNNTHTSSKPYKCACGETDSSKFYGNKHTVCGKCHSAYTHKLNKENREFIRKTLGNVCSRCGFDGPTCCYDIHHLDPTQKDPEFLSIRNWSRKRILPELLKCQLLCRNCHAIIHYAN